MRRRKTPRDKQPRKARSGKELLAQLEEAKELESITSRMMLGEPGALELQLEAAERFRERYPWLWDAMIDTAIALLVNTNARLELAHKLSVERVEYCRDRTHVLMLAKILRARGRDSEAESLEVEAEDLIDEHPRFRDEPMP